MSNFENFLSTNIVYLKKLTKEIIFNELLYNCISSTVIYIEKPSIWWPEQYFSHDKMPFFGIFRNYETKFCFWSFGNTIKIMVLIGGRVLTMVYLNTNNHMLSQSINICSMHFMEHILNFSIVTYSTFRMKLFTLGVNQHIIKSKLPLLVAYQRRPWLKGTYI